MSDTETSNKLKLNDLTIVVGPNGSGKSLAIRSSLKEIISKAKKKSQKVDTSKLLRKIETIVGGTYERNHLGLYFTSLEGSPYTFSIPIDKASSSAVKLANTYLFFKQAELGNTLILDEPENCLSPQGQVEFARVIAMAVNQGLNVVMSTHSDFIIKELNFLIALNSEFTEKDAFLKTYKQYSSSMFLRRDQVTTYHCENGHLSQYEINNHGVGISFFDNLITEMNDISDFLSENVDELSPSDFRDFPYGDVFEADPERMMALSIMKFLDRTGDTWRVLSWEEYVIERMKDNDDFSAEDLSREKDLFLEVAKHYDNSENVREFLEETFST